MGLRGPNASAYRVPHLPPPNRLEYKLKCPGCDRWFVSSRRDAVVCSPTCSRRVMRRARANVDKQPPPDTLVVSDEAVRIYNRMRKLEELHLCDCPDDDGDPDTMCRHCKRMWRLNSKLCGLLGAPCWQYSYWSPSWPSRRNMQAEIARFHALELASQAAAKARKMQRRVTRNATKSSDQVSSDS